VLSEPKRRRTQRTHDDYTVALICTQPKEPTAAIAMLDQRHNDLTMPPSDHNTYNLGSMSGHNVVIVCLPHESIDMISAAAVTTAVLSTFPSIQFGLLVGIGGGVPPKVRLGDVVASKSSGRFPGVVRWDTGKDNKISGFSRTGFLNNPPSTILTAMAKLQSECELNGSKIPQYLDELTHKWPRLAPRYLRSDSLQDILFKPDYGHVEWGSTAGAMVSNDDDEGEKEEVCLFCDRTEAIQRRPRGMRVHYGLIASGNKVIKDATLRDMINKEFDDNVLCFEMQAAGLMDTLPCIVIKGISDYADSHKNKQWQEHAAAVSTAFAKELLEYVDPAFVIEERPAKAIQGLG
jgi:nucleoside phosphorylase